MLEVGHGAGVDVGVSFEAAGKEGGVVVGPENASEALVEEVSCAIPVVSGAVVVSSWCGEVVSGWCGVVVSGWCGCEWLVWL